MLDILLIVTIIILSIITAFKIFNYLDKKFANMLKESSTIVKLQEEINIKQKVIDINNVNIKKLESQLSDLTKTTKDLRDQY